jgi:hypothetical protein
VPSTRHRTRHRRIAVLATSLVTSTLLVLAGATSVSAPEIPAPPAEPVAAATNPSRLPWMSGVYTPGGVPAQYAAFGTWRGRKIDVATMWTARATWPDIVNPQWLYRTWAGTPVVKVLGLPPIPEGGSASIASCGRGEYDGKWAEFGKNIRAAGMDDETIVRLGWEFNGDWYKWSARDPRAWVQCWRHVVHSAEKYAPALRWDWNVNRGNNSGLKDPREAWPGNRWVDIVGVDSYDMWPSVKNAAAWEGQTTGDYGLNFWLKWAVAHHKKLSVPEWGVYPGPGGGSFGKANGGDNPLYVTKMAEFFTANAEHIAYESYFNEPASYYAGAIYGPTQNPKAARAYLAAW